MNGTVKTRPCTACGKHFIGVADGLCPACEKDSAFYKATRKKGDPREFLPYPELLDQWRRRRAECREWRKGSEQTAEKWAAVAHSERERSYLLTVLDALNAGLDPALTLAAELDKTRAELATVTASRDYWAQRADELQAGKPDRHEALLREFSRLSGRPAFPPDMWRWLVQLAHLDKHGDSPAATEATRWLMENRP